MLGENGTYIEGGIPTAVGTVAAKHVGKVELEVEDTAVDVVGLVPKTGGVV